MADPGARGHSGEVLEALRTPLEEVVTLGIALVFERHVGFHRLGVAEFVDHHRVVDHEVDRHQRIDLGGIAAQLLDCVAHRGKIDHAGHAGEVLKENARRAVLDFLAGRGIGLPVDQRLDVRAVDREAAVLEAQQVFQQHFHRDRQLADIAQLLCGFRQRVIGVLLAVHVKRLAGAERVLADCGHGRVPSFRLARPRSTRRQVSRGRGFRRRSCAPSRARSRGVPLGQSSQIAAAGAGRGARAAIQQPVTINAVPASVGSVTASRKKAQPNRAAQTKPEYSVGTSTFASARA